MKNAAQAFALFALALSSFASPSGAGAAEKFVTIGTAGDYGVYFPTGIRPLSK